MFVFVFFCISFSPPLWILNSSLQCINFLNYEPAPKVNLIFTLFAFFFFGGSLLNLRFGLKGFWALIWINVMPPALSFILAPRGVRGLPYTPKSWPHPLYAHPGVLHAAHSVVPSLADKLTLRAPSISDPLRMPPLGRNQCKCVQNVPEIKVIKGLVNTGLLCWLNKSAPHRNPHVWISSGIVGVSKCMVFFRWLISYLLLHPEYFILRF